MKVSNLQRSLVTTCFLILSVLLVNVSVVHAAPGDGYWKIVYSFGGNIHSDYVPDIDAGRADSRIYFDAQDYELSADNSPFSLTFTSVDHQQQNTTSAYYSLPVSLFSDTFNLPSFGVWEFGQWIHASDYATISVSANWIPNNNDSVNNPPFANSVSFTPKIYAKSTLQSAGAGVATIHLEGWIEDANTSVHGLLTTSTSDTDSPEDPNVLLDEGTPITIANGGSHTYSIRLCNHLYDAPNGGFWPNNYAGSHGKIYLGVQVDTP